MGNEGERGGVMEGASIMLRGMTSAYRGVYWRNRQVGYLK
jgi:hypothetical protein